MMKSANILLAFIILIASCQQNQSNNKSHKDLIIGEWKSKEVSMNRNMKYDDFENDEDFEGYKKLLEELDAINEFQTELTFYENEKFLRVAGGDITAGKYNIEGDNLILNYGDRKDKLELFSLTNQDLVVKLELKKLESKTVTIDMIYKRKKKDQ